MVKRLLLFLILTFWISTSANSQVQSVNIGGSYSGSFMLSGGADAEYEIAGSPYLSEAWMFGSLEMKTDIIRKMQDDQKNKAKLYQYERKIKQINTLIEKLSDPEFEATGLALMMKGTDSEAADSGYDLRISNKDLEGFAGITVALEENLLQYLEQLRAEYEAQINDFFKINGLFRYNLYAQEIEMVHNRDTFAITAPFNVKSITISNMKFIHGLYVRRGSRTFLGSAYFQVLSEGECKLLRRHDVKIKGGSGPVTYNWAGGADAFVQYQQLYYQPEEGAEVIPLKKRRRSILKLFSDRSGEVADFIKQENMNVHDDGDLTRIFNYYNSLNS